MLQQPSCYADRYWTAVQVAAAALVAGVLDIVGSSPRRYLFEVLACFATEEREIERLQYFASPAGRDDLHTYNQGEGECDIGMAPSGVIHYIMI